MKAKMLLIFRWMLAMVAAIAAFVGTFVQTMIINRMVAAFFCREDNSGSCMDPDWLEPTIFFILMILGAALAAILVVVFGSVASPSRRRHVPWIFFGCGTTVALGQIISSVSYLTSRWRHFIGSGDRIFELALLIAPCAAICAGFCTARLLNRKMFTLDKNT
jgi:hypothetical protein